MKNPFRLSFIVTCLLAVSCGTPATDSKVATQSKNSDSTNMELPDEMTLKLKGMIGDDIVLMDLIKEGENLDGTYLNTSSDSSFVVSGNVDAAGNFNLLESDEEHHETGNFTGRFINEKLLEGEWKSIQPGSGSPFRLAATTDKPLETSMIEKEIKACEHAGKMKAKPLDDYTEIDTMCATLKLSILEVESVSASANDKINNAIVAEACRLSGFDSTSTTLDELIGNFRKFESEGDAPGVSTTISCNILMNEKDIFSVSIDVLYDNFGAAHPSGQSTVLNFDAKSGNIISLNNLMLVDYTSRLNSIAEKLFIEENGKEGWDFKPGKFRLCKDFAITNEGLRFYFDSYEIGPYAMGAPEVLIPYGAISDLIRPYGPLEHWRKK